jgi:hypothetical protein
MQRDTAIEMDLGILIDASKGFRLIWTSPKHAAASAAQYSNLEGKTLLPPFALSSRITRRLGIHSKGETLIDKYVDINLICLTPSAATYIELKNCVQSLAQ